VLYFMDPLRPRSRGCRKQRAGRLDEPGRRGAPGTTGRSTPHQHARIYRVRRADRQRHNKRLSSRPALGWWVVGAALRHCYSPVLRASPMEDFNQLDPETRCFALVGQFLQAWSVMEASLHKAIGAALDIEDVKLSIICANIEFSKKIYILRTLIDASPAIQEDTKEKFLSSLKGLGNFAQLRNIIAHNRFQPDDSEKGVEFLIVKASGTFASLREVWLFERFRSEHEKIAQHQSLLEEVVNFFTLQPLAPTNYAHALRRPFLPAFLNNFYPGSMQRGVPPVLLDSLSRQAPAAPDSTPHPSNGKISPQTPFEFEE
jgi:hypothetical protein